MVGRLLAPSDTIGSFPSSFQRHGLHSLRTISRPSYLLVHARRTGDGNRNNNREGNARKGSNYENKKRRRGRPAHLRSPDDTPFRSVQIVSAADLPGWQPRQDNRPPDTEVNTLFAQYQVLECPWAAKTLTYYLSETNLNLYHWLTAFMEANPIPRDGVWDDVSGEAFLRTLLSMPVQEIQFGASRPALYVLSKAPGVDPRSLAQRIMDIRTQIAKEMIEDLNQISEENSLLLRESLSSSLEKMFAPSAALPVIHPKVAEAGVTPPTLSTRQAQADSRRRSSTDTRRRSSTTPRRRSSAPASGPAIDLSAIPPTKADATPPPTLPPSPKAVKADSAIDKVDPQPEVLEQPLESDKTAGTPLPTTQPADPKLASTPISVPSPNAQPGSKPSGTKEPLEDMSPEIEQGQQEETDEAL